MFARLLCVALGLGLDLPAPSPVEPAPPRVQDEPSAAQRSRTARLAELESAAASAADGNAAELDAALAALVRDFASLAGPATVADQPLLERGRALALQYARIGVARPILETLHALYLSAYGADHASTLAAESNLATVLYQLGDFRAAREWAERVLPRYERIHGPEHPACARVLTVLGALQAESNEFGAARDTLARAVAAFELHRGPNDFELLSARGNLAGVLEEVGESEAALVIKEEVLRGFEATLPAGHPNIALARSNMALTLDVLGQTERAHAYFAEAARELAAVLPANHPQLVAVIAGYARATERLGDLVGAAGILERALRAFEEVAPGESAHARLLRRRLAGCATRLGDTARARSLWARDLEFCLATLPPDDPEVLIAQHNLACEHLAAGDLVAARALFEIVLEARERVLPPGDALTLSTSFNLAGVLYELRDFAEAKERWSDIAQQLAQRTDAEDLLQLARINLAMALTHLGETASALELLARAQTEGAGSLDDVDLRLIEGAASIALRELGRYDEASALARTNYASWCSARSLGDVERVRAAHALAYAQVLAGRRNEALDAGHVLATELETFARRAATLPVREASESVAQFLAVHALVLTLRKLAPTDQAAANFDLTFALREAAAARPRTQLARTDATYAALERDVAEVRQQLGDLLALGGAVDDDAARSIVRLGSRRDTLERALRERAAALDGDRTLVTAQILAAALPPDAAAIGFVHLPGFALAVDGERVRLWSRRDQLVAFVVTRTRTLEIELGAADEIRSAVADWRAALGRSSARGIEIADVDREVELGESLRARLFDPLAGVLGEECRVVHLCLDDSALLVPFDALPVGDQRLGDRYEFRRHGTFRALVEPRSPAAASSPSMLLVGGVDFDGRPADAANAPVTTVQAAFERSGDRPSFAPLTNSRFEVRTIGDLFEEEFGTAALVHERLAASKAMFLASAPGTRYLHVATHGWFALDENSLPPASGDALPARHDGTDRRTGFAPLTLCGLAFAGANQGRDEFGRVPGILTAEELAGVDLSACELAVLSACETDAGVRRAGQGLQSLQSALHSAGVRCSVTSLWRVDDAATRELMTHFYDGLWREGLAPPQALWRAKCLLRASGVPVAGWAAWVLGGA